MLCLFCQKTKSKKSGIFPIFFLSNHLVVFFIEETPVSSSSQRRFALNCSTSHLIKVINQGVMTRKPLIGMAYSLLKEFLLMFSSQYS